MSVESVGCQCLRARARLAPKPGACAVFFFSLALLLGLAAFAGPAPQAAGPQTREADFDTRHISVVTFASDVQTTLVVQCWEKPQLHLAWVFEAASGDATPEAEALAAREFKVSAAPEGEAINVRVSADASRFRVERVAGSPDNPRGEILRDKLTGMGWTIRLRASVPFGMKINSQRFVGTTSFECGAGETIGGGRSSALNLTGRADLDTGAAAKWDAVTVKSETALSLLVKRVEPRYPALAAEAGVRGEVVFSVLVNDRGEVEKVRVTHGHPLLKDATVRAASLWRFTPYTAEGKAVPFVTSLTVKF